ncbi:MAG: HipA domain-containing protein [Saprospiraceae bacterium]
MENRCPITYQLCGSARYSAEGLKLLNRNLAGLHEFPYTAPEQRLEAAGRMTRMSIQGVQPKLSAVVDLKAQGFKIVESGGHFIIKPQHEAYPFMPENEDLTMRLAAIIGIEVPLHGLLYCKDGSFSYFIRRFDRIGRREKYAVEDFSQLAGMTRETKYDFTIEQMIKLIDKYCSFPVVEKAKFFRLVLFCFLTGNEDMHLKNFSLITRKQKTEFSPAYDLLNTTLVLGNAEEEMAMMLAGRRKEFRRKELVDYFGRERLNLTEAVIANVLNTFKQAYPSWGNLIAISFLSDKQKVEYAKLLHQRFQRLSL